MGVGFVEEREEEEEEVEDVEKENVRRIYI